MKKIIFLFSLLLLAVGLSAQTYGTADYSTPQGGGTSGTTTSYNAYGAAKSYVWLVTSPEPYYYTLQVKLADVSAGSTANTATSVLSGSVDGTTFKTITSVSYAAGGTDTTIFYQITSSPLSYRYLKLTVTPTDSIKLDRALLKLAPVK